MKVVDYLHALLDKKRGSADDLKRRVSRYPDDGTLNDPSPFREPPLVRVLQSNMCSPSVVRMLLDRGASVHRGAPLTVAIRNCGAITEEIVRELLLCGADATELDKFGQSSVCHALQAGAPASVFRLLLDGGCFPDLCRNHVSVLHCASFRPESGLSVDVFRLLLDAGANVLVAGSSGQSPLCFALRGGLDAAGLRLMLDAGVSVDACGRHASSLVCATDQGWGRTLRADVVRTLLLAGAATECVNGNGWAPLHLALRYLAYETDAVKALLDIPGVDVNGPEVGWKMDSLLHLAVHNSHCTLTMVKLLVSRGAQLDKVNRHGDTPLHYAVTNEECQPVVIQFLLQKRAVVNVRNKRNKSPLRVAIEQDRSVEVIHLLLGAGAKLSVLKDKMDYSLLKLVVDLYEEKAARELARERERAYFRVKDKKRLLEKDSETSLSSLWERLEVVIAYAYLENAEVTMEYLSGRWQNSPQLLDFSKKYSEDFKKMAATDLGRGHTLLEFLNSRSRCQKRLKSKYYKLCRLLAVVRNFPTFFNVIAEKVGVESMKAALRNLKVSVVKESSVPIIEESSVPAIEESSVPDIDESSVPIIEDFSVPIIEESSVPIIEESSVPDIDESSVPAIEESSFPDIEEYSISAVDDPLTSTEDGYRKSNGTWVQRVFGVSTVPNSSCSVRDDSCASTVSESSVFTIDNICDLTSNNSVVEVFSASTIPTCTNNSSSSEVNGSIVPTVIDLCDSDDSSFPEVQKSSNSSVSSVNGDSKVVISGVSIADDTRVSTVADFNDSTVEDYSASELDIAYFITVGDSTVNTSSVSTVDDSNVSTVDVSSSVSKTDSSTVSAVDDSRVSTVADSTLQEPNRSEQRIYLNYECLCDIARFLSSSDLLCFVLAFGVPCRNAVAVEVSKDVPPETESCSPSADKPTKEQESTVSTDVQPRTELCSPSTDKPTKEQESTESKGLQPKTECPSTNKPTHKQESTVSKDLQPKKDPCSPTLDKPIKEQESTVNDDVQSHAGSSRLPTKEQNSPSCKRKSVPLCPKHQPTCCQHSSVNDDIQSHAGPSRLPTKEQNSPSCKRVSVPLCPKHQPTCGQHSPVNEDIQSQAGPSRLPAREQNSPSCKRVPLCSKHQPTCNSALSVNEDIQSQAGPSRLPCATREQNLPRCKRTSIPLCPKHPPTCCHHKHRNSHDPYWKKKKKRKNSSFPSTSSDENHKSLPKSRQKKRKRNSRCNIHVNKTASSQDS